VVTETTEVGEDKESATDYMFADNVYILNIAAIISLYRRFQEDCHL
jgi:hypothetical protein